MLSILDFELFPSKKKNPNYDNDDDDDDYTTFHSILDEKTQARHLKDLRWVFVELPKFKKSERNLSTLEEQWLNFLKRAPEHADVPGDLPQEIKKAYHSLERLKWSE